MIDLLISELNAVLGGRFDTFKAIGRETVANDGNIEYFPSDNKGRFGYVRFDSDTDYEFTEERKTSRGGSYIVVSDLAALVFADCKNIGEVSLNLIRALNFLPNFEVTVKDCTTNKELILKEEAGYLTNNNPIKCARVRFAAKWQYLPDCILPETENCEKC